MVFAVLVTLIALTGGSSWPEAWQLLILRPLAVLLTALIVILPGPIDHRVARVPGWLLVALALVMVIQLIPLPPAWWMALPGHAPFAEAAAAAGVEQPWRPITLSTDLTLNSLVSLIIPAAVLLGMAALRRDQRTAIAALVISLAVLSGLLGLLQITVGPTLYFYSPANIGRPVGLFANINHQAAVLAATIPLAAGWVVAVREVTPARAIAGAAAGVFLFAAVLVSGSRSGLLLAALAALSVPLVIGGRLRLPPRVRRLAIIGGGVVAAGLIAATWLVGRLGALDRLLAGGGDQRLEFLPITLEILRTYSPFGSGFGTFDAAFRIAEPDAILQLIYFNHAHNDLLELGITGGVLALVVAAAYLAWLCWRGVALFVKGQDWSSRPLARGALVMALLLLLASLLDYPLRTPLAMAMLALASVWVAGRRGSVE